MSVKSSRKKEIVPCVVKLQKILSKVQFMARLDNILKYEFFHAEDFISDTFFLEWVTSPSNREYSAFWNKLVEIYPDKCIEIEIAKDILLNNYQGQGLNPLEEEELWRKINKSLLS